MNLFSCAGSLSIPQYAALVYKHWSNFATPLLQLKADGVQPSGYRWKTTGELYNSCSKFKEEFDAAYYSQSGLELTEKCKAEKKWQSVLPFQSCQLFFHDPHNKTLVSNSLNSLNTLLSQGYSLEDIEEGNMLAEIADAQEEIEKVVKSTVLHYPLKSYNEYYALNIKTPTSMIKGIEGVVHRSRIAVEMCREAGVGVQPALAEYMGLSNFNLAKAMLLPSEYNRLVSYMDAPSVSLADKLKYMHFIMPFCNLIDLAYFVAFYSFYKESNFNEIVLKDIRANVNEVFLDPDKSPFNKNKMLYLGGGTAPGDYYEARGNEHRVADYLYLMLQLKRKKEPLKYATLLTHVSYKRSLRWIYATYITTGGSKDFYEKIATISLKTSLSNYLVTTLDSIHEPISSLEYAQHLAWWQSGVWHQGTGEVVPQNAEKVYVEPPARHDNPFL